jgi:hypothetical protein
MGNSLTYNSGDAGFSYIVANVDLVILLLFCLLTFLNTIAEFKGALQGSTHLEKAHLM